MIDIKTLKHLWLKWVKKVAKYTGPSESGFLEDVKDIYEEYPNGFYDFVIEELMEEKGQNEPLKCTHNGCEELQTEDGEFCDRHHPGKMVEVEKEELKEILDRLIDIAEAYYPGYSGSDEIAIVDDFYKKNFK